MSATEIAVEYTYGGDETPAEAVVAAMATVSNQDPVNMKPLYEYIDPDALNALFKSRSYNSSEPGEIQMQFDIERGRVKVTGDHVCIREHEDN